MKRSAFSFTVKLFWILLLSMSSHFLFGQDLKVDMKQVSDRFKNAISVMYDIKVSTYSNEKSIPEIDYFHYEQNGRQYYYSNALLEMYLDKSISLMVYKDQRMILYSKTDQAQLFSKKNLPSISMDSVFYNMDSIRYLGESNGLRKYAIYYSAGYVIRTEICIDSKTNLLVEMTYFYNPEKQVGYFKTITHFDKLILSDQVLPISKTKLDFLTGEIPNIKKTSSYSNYTLKYVDND